MRVLHNLTVLLAATTASAAELGDPIDKALAVHIPPHGLSTVGDAVARLVPPSLPIEVLEGEFACSEDTATLDYALEPLDVLLVTDWVDIVPTDGRLDLTIYATLSSTASNLTVEGDCAVFVDLDEVCTVEIPTTAVEIHLGMGVEVVGDEIRADVDAVTVDMSPIGNPLEGCTLASAVGTVLGQDPGFISDTLLSFVEPSLVDIAPSIEEAVEGIFAQLVLDTTLPLPSAELSLSLYPSLLELDENGIAIGMGAQIDIDQTSDCVDWVSGIELTEADWPDFSKTAPGTSLEYDAGLFLSRDFLDMTLYTAWASGALCIELSDLNGAALGTDLFKGLIGGRLTELFPENVPARLVVDPQVLPRARFEEDQPPLHVDVALALDLYAELDGRDARLFRSDVVADAGLDVDLTTESLALSLVLPDGALQLTDGGSELIGPGYSVSLEELVSTVLDNLLPPDLLPTLSLPSLLGMEVAGVVWLPSEDGAWQGGYLLLDTEGVAPIELAGCGSSELGCDGGGGGADLDLETALGCNEEAAGCGSEVGGSSCSHLGAGRVVPLMILVPGLLVRRRRAGLPEGFVEE